LERELAGRLVQTPYVLLLSFPRINVVSAAEFAGEAGPMEYHASHRSLTGRAGQRRVRYESNQVDQADGPLLRNCNRALQAAILTIADNFIICNHPFNIWNLCSNTRATISAISTSALVTASVASPSRWSPAARCFAIPASRDRPYSLDKLTAFHRLHDTAMAQVLGDLQAAIGQLPRPEYAAEARPLQEEMERLWAGRRRGPQLLGDILPIVFARLGVGMVQSQESGE
jgi:hypothetical protein